MSALSFSPSPDLLLHCSPALIFLPERQKSSELFGKGDNDDLRTADVGEPVHIPVLHFANEFGPAGSHARNDRIDVIDSEHEMKRVRLGRQEDDRKEAQ